MYAYWCFEALYWLGSGSRDDKADLRFATFRQAPLESNACPPLKFVPPTPCAPTSWCNSRIPGESALSDAFFFFLR